jgi:single-stranded DNA-binding protein
MTKQTPELLPLDDARELFPHEPPSRRWLSSMARKVGAYVKIGRRAYVTSDIVVRIREWQNAHGAEKAKKITGTSASLSRSESMEKSSDGGVNTALDALENQMRKR